MGPKNNLPQKDCQHCAKKCNNQAAMTARHLPWDGDVYYNFPIKIARHECPMSSPMFEGHWHEQIQFFWVEQGEAQIFCNTKAYVLNPEDILIINSNEIHYGLTNNSHLVYYLIKPSFDFLASSQSDLCQIKYITPLQKNIRFQNLISKDIVLSRKIKEIIEEYAKQASGYELAIKAHVYQVLVHLLRHYQLKNLTPAEQERQQKTLYQLRSALSYMDEHYNEAITLSELASLAHMSSQYFCHLFKKLTGKRPMDYINCLRVNKAASLLADGSLNISEVAMAVGFDDSNYFSRIFRKYKNISPSALKK